MKKTFYIVAFIAASFTLILASMSLNCRKRTSINKLVLNNVECLASNENPPTPCLGIGSLDCPSQNFQKVKYIWL